MPTGIYIRTDQYRKEVSIRNKKLGIKPINPYRGVGVTHPLWKGDAASYRAIHLWVEKWLGKPTTCQDCAKQNLFKKHIHWANISGNYTRVYSDWVRLCTSCHKMFDWLKKIYGKLFYTYIKYEAILQS